MSTKKLSITIEIPDEHQGLEGYTDSYIANLWHAAQANPKSSFEDREVGRIVEVLGFEIIRRFLVATPPELYHHQAAHFDRERARIASETTTVKLRVDATAAINGLDMTLERIGKATHKPQAAEGASHAR